jgi:hypothetical protein
MSRARINSWLKFLTASILIVFKSLAIDATDLSSAKDQAVWKRVPAFDPPAWLPNAPVPAVEIPHPPPTSERNRSHVGYYLGCLENLG